MPTEISTPLPSPPTIEPPHMPTAAPIHKKMMETVLHHRCRQLERLSRHSRHFERFVFHLVKALNRSRYEESAGGRVDLLTGEYIDYLLTHTEGMEGITLDKVACHFIALMYRSLDERLPSEMRLHAVGCVRKASSLLKEWLEKVESGKDLTEGAVEDEINDDVVDTIAAEVGRKNKRRSGDTSGFDDDDSTQRKESSSKRFRKSYLEVDIASDSLGTNKAKPSNSSKENRRVSDGSNEETQGLEKKAQQQNTEGGSERASAIEANSPHASALKSPSSRASTQEKDSSGHQTDSFHEVSKQTAGGEHSILHQQNRITRAENDNKDQIHYKTNDTMSNAEKANTHDKTTPSTQSTKQSMTEKTSTKMRDVSRKSRGTAVSDIEMADSTISVHATKKSSSRWGPTITHTMTTPVSTKDVSKPKDIPDADRSNRTADSIGAREPRGNVAFTRAASESRNTTTSSDNSRPNSNRKTNDVGPVSSAKPIERLTTSQSTSITHPPAVSEKNGISSGSASAFAPVNSNGTAGAASSDSAVKSGPSAALSASTTKHTDNNRTSTAVTTERPDSQNVPDNSNKSNETDPSQGARKSNADEQDIIDLTTPPGSPRASLPTDEGPTNLAAIQPPTTVIKQLPPSPPPVTKVLKPSPLPFPPPRPFAETRQVAFLADNKIPYASGSLHPRPANSFSYNSGFYLDGSGACLEHRVYIDVQERLRTWDPYWRIVGDLGTRKVKASDSGMTFVGTRTTACVPNRQNLTASNSSSVNSCAVLPLNLPRVKEDSPTLFDGVKWGELATPDPSGSRIRDHYKTGDTRLIIRTLPLFRTSKDIKKRADTHIWPQGTVVQLGGKSGGSLSDEFIVPITQRRQEKHDEKSWKGMSHILDLTKYANPQHPLSIKLSSCEVVESVQNPASCVGGSLLSGSYAVHAAICKYVSPDDLFDMLMGLKDGGDILIPTLSERSAKVIAKDYVANQTVALIDSDDEDSGNKSSDESNSLTFSLLCPIQRTPMETPVRGRNCKHLQCFDLKNFLRINESISGGRWRCGNCEDFLSVRDLVHCGLFQAMIDKYKGQISGIRDKVSLQSDGSFSLKDENKLRYANKKGGGASKSEQSHTSAASSEVIIDLD
ncbi:hypothetical protein HJC23_013481 [Cyclotella cryptica]|uniref:SP-RING-type domain-containing protein n=1 Tax=Cyclotella cryptica TaxID=29204 RepID=A0ABD3QB93_9STRA|eukprot:CCRYP_006897-RA/>CCRYP_006897-RA protein AED:0.23 eAED:-0.29 QI:0/0/0/1/1/1/2/0/1118